MWVRKNTPKKDTSLNVCNVQAIDSHFKHYGQNNLEYENGSGFTFGGFIFYIALLGCVSCIAYQWYKSGFKLPRGYRLMNSREEIAAFTHR